MATMEELTKKVMESMETVKVELDEIMEQSKSQDQDVFSALIADLRMREKQGEKSYGEKSLLPFNGTNSIQDLYEELLDACVYLKKFMMELDVMFGARLQR